MEVAILGATGATGSSIINALLDAGSFSITALVRPSSLNSEAARDLASKGVAITSFDLNAPSEELAQKIKGKEVLLAAISIPATGQQIALATVAKTSGVKRFVPCFYAPVAPPKGVVALRDIKEDVLNHVKKLHLPYTIVDIGWWMQFTLPRLPSGRFDASDSGVATVIPGDGNVVSAFTDNRDFGKFVARIIVDPRTMNKAVFAYSEMKTVNQIYDLLEEMSGETLPRQYLSGDEILAKLASLGTGPFDPNSKEYFTQAVHQYWYSWAVRGDNTLDYARYLGYLIGHELYPDVKLTSFREHIQELLSAQ
ncbi:isoflavone reductase family protein [Colletotrichum tofieldiae]|uniref:Isoflavone reductase family protein n=1 Tax=Colletotrichum tofieldiae TaxID=708197 RepID=A0A166TXB1_9PEZI|nr:isoflavone reductase family protein [Colletotrichum tofieldiae]GKT95766.1 isoflavone reductase family protein [Colletotrichum tofieldiae]